MPYSTLYNSLFVSRILDKELADYKHLNHNETRILVGILTPLRVEFFGQLTSANESNRKCLSNDIRLIYLT